MGLDDRTSTLTPPRSSCLPPDGGPSGPVWVLSSVEVQYIKGMLGLQGAPCGDRRNVILLA